MNSGSGKQFPEGFLIGFGTSCFQIEGAWDEDGKGENIWDRFIHENPERVLDKSCADIACNSYHLYEEDVKIIKELGGEVYRFSISWSRILPTGFVHEINQRGIDYYNALIDKLIENGIQPMVTLYHWDLPQPLSDLGGWTNPRLVDYFCDFADVAFRHFGDRVKKWITFNEPYEVCYTSYATGEFAPGLSMPGIAEYLAGDTILKSHAKAYHLYDSRYRESQQGVIGISISSNWVEPKTESPEDIAAANDLLQFTVGWFAHPIFSKDGDYPPEMKRKVSARSKEEGFQSSRLPELEPSWISYIRGTSDFYGFNHYTTVLASHNQAGNSEKGPSFKKDHNVITSTDPGWIKMNSWLHCVPSGFRKSLNWVTNQYNKPIIFVTENGCCENTSVIQDTRRIYYFQLYLTEMLRAIHDDGCRLQMYIAWSLMDNFEWKDGYREKFGVYCVDFASPNRPRTPKLSAKFFKFITKNRRLPAVADEERGSYETFEWIMK